MKKTAYAYACLLAGTLSAQNLTVTATGGMTIRWQGSGPPQQVSQVVTGSTTLQVSGVGSADLTVGSTTTLTLTALGPPPGFGWSDEVQADITVSYSADAPIAGILRLNLVPACNGALVGPSFINVENDGWIDLQGYSGPVQAVVPVVLGPRPIPIHIANFTENMGSPSCVTTASVEFVASPTNLQTTGVACGPSLAASLLPPAQHPGRLVLHIDDAPQAPSSIVAAIAFGSSPVPMGTTCTPGLIADGWLLLTPAAGGLDLAIPLSTNLVGSVELQHVGLQLPFALQWSNRLSLTLP